MWVDVDAGDGGRRIYCRDFGGEGTPLVYLHSGWGYGVYPFERQVDALGSPFRVLAPDRWGYGQSGRWSAPVPLDFHQRAARETLAVLDGLGLERAMLWGQSDGACIAGWMGLFAPERCQAIVLEALHLDRFKPGSREFFETMASDPSVFGDGVGKVLADEHGADYWQELLRLEGEVWLEIGGTEPDRDLYHERLGELTAPVLILHGAQDPRTEPGELERALAALPGAELCLLDEGRHCPHHESRVWQQATEAARAFLIRHA